MRFRRTRQAISAVVAVAVGLSLAIVLVGNLAGTEHTAFALTAKQQYCKDHPKQCLKKTHHRGFAKGDSGRVGCWTMNAKTSVDGLPFDWQGDYIADVVGGAFSMRFCSKDGVHISSSSWGDQLQTHHESWLWNWDGWQVADSHTFWDNESMGEAHRWSIVLVWSKGVQALSWHRSVTLTCIGYVSTYSPITRHGRWNCS